MTHVQIRSPHPEYGPGSMQFLLNGVDISMDVAAERVTVDPPDHHKPGDQPTVSIKLVCDSLDMDLPDAFLEATKAEHKTLADHG